jgi:hypothetical protein
VELQKFGKPSMDGLNKHFPKPYFVPAMIRNSMSSSAAPQGLPKVALVFPGRRLPSYADALAFAAVLARRAAMASLAHRTFASTK